MITVEEVDGEMDLYLLRQPGRSSKVKLENQLGLLWKSELSIQHYLEICLFW